MSRGTLPEARTLEEPRFQERTRPGGDLARMLGVSNGQDAVYTPLFGPDFGSLALGGNCSSEERQKGSKEAGERKGKLAAKERGGAGKASRGQHRQLGGGSAVRERDAFDELLQAAIVAHPELRKELNRIDDAGVGYATACAEAAFLAGLELGHDIRKLVCSEVLP